MRTKMRHVEGFRETPSPRVGVRLFLRAKPKSHATLHGSPNTPPTHFPLPALLWVTSLKQDRRQHGAKGTNDPPERHRACSQQMQREGFSEPTLSD